MSVGKGFAGGFGGCIGVGCAIIALVVAVPLGCSLVAMIGLGTAANKAAQDAAERAKQGQDAPEKADEALEPMQADKDANPSEPPANDIGESIIRSAKQDLPHAPATAPPANAKPKDSHPTHLAVSSAAAIFAFYEKNEVKADYELKDKWLAVKGKVEKIGKDIINTPYVALSIEKEFSIFSVQCIFTKGDERILAELTPGQTVVIGGKCAGKFGNVLIKECWFYDEGADELEKRMQQAELAKQEAEEKRKIDEARRQQEAMQHAKIEEAKWHTWTSADGLHKIEGKFLKAIGDTVHLEKRDGTVVKIQRDKLSTDDWDWIKKKSWTNP